MTNKVSLKNSSTGDVAGRDVITNIFSGSTSPITHLLSKLAEGEDEETRGFINRLKHFVSESSNENNKIIGLKTKLMNGGAEDYYILYATELKEEFAKLLEINSTSLHTQEVYVHLMSSIRSKFAHHIRPVLSHAPCPEILDLLHEKVIMPTLAMVTPNPLQMNEETISGMLFYLTGNCHLEWGNAGL
jgi:hypothetical protein